MKDYVKLRVDISPCSETATDLVAAFLADAGYETFEPDTEGLAAYIPAEMFDLENARETLEDFPMECNIELTSEHIEGRDWNKEWETKYFRPIQIGDCLIHSSFHTDLPDARYNIVIDPKMAFGTGHHSTTSLIVSYLLDIDLQNAAVIDMGTGTGILAILCTMRGATDVTGIEIDPAAYENAIENAALNNAPVKLICGDASALEELQPADLFLANINRNVILADLDTYVERLKTGGMLILSGFYKTDIPMVQERAEMFGMTLLEIREDNDWVALLLSKR